MAKKVENKKQVKPNFDRDDHTFRDNWIKRALKEIKSLEVRETKTSRKGETEPSLFFRKVKVLQLAHSKKGYFTGYLYKPNSRQIIRVTHDDEAELLYELLMQRIQELEDLLCKPKIVKSSNGIREL